MVSLSRAFYAFYNELIQEPCPHRHVNLKQGPTFCPDCGQKVKLQWVQVKCQRCDGRRLPKKNFDGTVAPLHKHCRGCGCPSYRLVKKDKIDAHEIPYSVALKEIDYSEAAKPVFSTGPTDFMKHFEARYGKGDAGNYYAKTHGQPHHVVEGQVVNQRNVG